MSKINVELNNNILTIVKNRSKNNANDTLVIDLNDDLFAQVVYKTNMMINRKNQIKNIIFWRV